MDTGLGKDGQGDTDFIQVKEKLGRRGLGFKVDGFEAAKLDRKVAIIEDVKQTPDWLPSCEEDIPTSQELMNWLSNQVVNMT